jgi:hypothetical protein
MNRMPADRRQSMKSRPSELLGPTATSRALPWSNSIRSWSGDWPKALTGSSFGVSSSVDQLTALEWAPGRNLGQGSYPSSRAALGPSCEHPASGGKGRGHPDQALVQEARRRHPESDRPDGCPEHSLNGHHLRLASALIASPAARSRKWRHGPSSPWPRADPHGCQGSTD